MKWILKYYCILLIGHILRSFFSLYPIRKRNVIFISFDGNKVSCNPYYIYQYLLDRNEYEMFWVLKNKECRYKIPEDRIIIKKGFLYYKMMLTAGFIITNDRIASYFIFRKGQIIINTWHGGGAFKRTFGYPKGIMKWYNNKITSLDSKRTTLFLSSSRMWTEVIARKSFLYKGDVLSSGFPRNDIFFHNNNLKTIVRKKLNISEEYNVILYAPTYRGNAMSGSLGKTSLVPLDINKLKEAWLRRNGRKCVVLFRGHHTMRNGISLSDTIDVSNYPDMQELLLLADGLISDYSSCMWDFALTKKPCFIYAPDFEDYLRNPGFESNYREWPFFVCKDNDTLIHTIVR